MFDQVADRYDLTNTVLSFGRDRYWRRLTRAALDIGPGDRVLDLACGTAVSTVELARGEWLPGPPLCVGCDFSAGMLARATGRGVRLVAGDGLALPFRDGVFDAVTVSFGLRNMADIDLALTELARVARPNGRLVVCEFSHPTWAPFRRVYVEYLMRALPRVASHVSSNPDAYVYLAESIRAWPTRHELAARIASAGWHEVAWRDMTGGIATLHRAVRTDHGDRAG